MEEQQHLTNSAFINIATIVEYLPQLLQSMQEAIATVLSTKKPGQLMPRLLNNMRYYLFGDQQPCGKPVA